MVEEMMQQIRLKNFLSFEIVPSAGGFNKQIESLNKSGIVDRINGFICTDSPRSCLKTSPFFASIKLQDFFKKPTICTLSMRDRNSLALQADLIGANIFDVRSFLALTGDSVKLGDQLNAKPVFEGRSSLLIHIIHALNQGVDIYGKPLKQPLKPIYPLCAMNSYAHNFDSLKSKMYKKIQSGVLAIITQPIYDINIARTLLGWLLEINKELGTQTTLILGFYPVVSFKNALFLREKLPGLFVPDEWIDELYKAQKQGKEIERAKGVAMSTELFHLLWNIHSCIHFMSSGHLKIAKEILFA